MTIYEILNIDWPTYELHKERETDWRYIPDKHIDMIFLALQLVGCRRCIEVEGQPWCSISDPRTAARIAHKYFNKSDRNIINISVVRSLLLQGETI